VVSLRARARAITKRVVHGDLAVGPGGLLYVSRFSANQVLKIGPDNCVADITPSPGGNGTVNIDDLFAVISNWGPCPGCAADINQSGIVDIDDVLIVVSGWGPCP
jgi:hypothetical protein